MAGSHEGVFEDGELIECGVCKARVHSLEPELGLCDTCATEGWLAPREPWKLRRGDIVAREGQMALVISVDQVADRHWIIELMPLPGQFIEMHRGVGDKSFVHQDTSVDLADAEIRRRL